MKGYGIYLAIVIAVLLALPPLFVRDEPSGQAATSVDTAVQDEIFRVMHSDQSGVSEIGAYELTLYETAATIAADAPVEAIKAQAVAVYTSFCYQRRIAQSGAVADVTATALPFPQSFTDSYWREQWGTAYDTNMQTLKAAVSAVYGKRVLYEGEAIMALSHAMNGGMTENAGVLLGTDLPYLRAVASPADALSGQQLSTVTVAVADAAPMLQSLCDVEVGDPASWFGEVQKTAAGTVTSILVCAKPISGQQLQSVFSLPSAAFEVCVQEGSVIFTVHGSGHFVGMSRCGAIAMANEGQTYETILKHYYSGVVIE